MDTLDQRLAYVPPGATQRRALALMEVDVYQRRRLPRAPTAAVGVQAPGWDEQLAGLPLARAIARAAGAADAAAWSAAWTADGGVLPDLTGLRDDPEGKRALWRALRVRLRRP